MQLEERRPSSSSSSSSSSHDSSGPLVVVDAHNAACEDLEGLWRAGQKAGWEVYVCDVSQRSLTSVRPALTSLTSLLLMPPQQVREAMQNEAHINVS